MYTNKITDLDLEEEKYNILYNNIINNNNMNTIKNPRCPRGSRRNKSTGLCEKKVKNLTKKITKKVKKRCPRGSRRNKSTGLCEKKSNLLNLSVEERKYDRLFTSIIDESTLILNKEKKKKKRCPKGCWYCQTRLRCPSLLEA